MEEVQLQTDEKGHGHFYISENAAWIAEMEIGISGNELTVFHTEVSPKAEGKGFGKKLFLAMTNYSRKHQLRVIALCPFVHAQFKRHAAEYADIWKQ